MKDQARINEIDVIILKNAFDGFSYKPDGNRENMQNNAQCCHDVDYSERGELSKARLF